MLCYKTDSISRIIFIRKQAKSQVKIFRGFQNIYSFAFTNGLRGYKLGESFDSHTWCLEKKINFSSKGLRIELHLSPKVT